jgi:hypothetical protein
MADLSEKVISNKNDIISVGESDKEIILTPKQLN